MYQICDHFMKPLTIVVPHQCSLVTLVADGPQCPVWFVSHAWSTQFYESIGMITYHAEQHGLALESLYWICTFANNQWDLSELVGGLRETLFYQAIIRVGCKGVVSLMDQNCTPLERV